MKITLTVVLYKHSQTMLKNFLLSCEKSVLYAQHALDAKFQLYIVNNDTSKEIDYEINELKNNSSALSIEFINSDKNGGYGYGNNFVLDKVNGDYHLVVNPDIIFFEDTFLKAIQFMEAQKGVGLLTPMIYDQNSQLQFSCKKNPTLFSQFLRFTFKHEKRFFKTYLERYEYQDHSYSSEIYDVPNCTGCFMFFRVNVFKAVRGFDERFFYYMDDCDLSRRALEVSRTAYVPSVRVVHEYQGDAYKNKKLRNEAIKSAFKYWRKWGGLF
ncbi:glycosyltransferase [Cysteiniphilum halobium]|uniref:glycosyltransferase n=1 Tax=Cysteiniphilum halobium TaxID=2219059 RepID=UPI000E64D4F6|nr:glycosyltransferase [Cysteiniphilum halobium]